MINDYSFNMFIFRGLRQRLRQTNPCTLFLLVLLIAVVIFLISAAKENPRGTVGQAAVAISGSASHDRHHLNGDPDEHFNTEPHQRKLQMKMHRWLIIGDEEVQTCLMTPQWTKSGADGWNDHPMDKETIAHKKDRNVLCGLDDDESPTELFYIQDGWLKKNLTKLQHWTVDNCSAEEIIWKTDHEYKMLMVSDSSKISSEFVRVKCFVRKNYGNPEVDDMARKSYKATYKSKTSNNSRDTNLTQTERHLSNFDAMEEQTKQMYRNVVHQHSPRLTGSVGLPDPSDHMLGNRISQSLQNTNDDIVVRSETKTSSYAEKQEQNDSEDIKRRKTLLDNKTSFQLHDRRRNQPANDEDKNKLHVESNAVISSRHKYEKPNDQPGGFAPGEDVVESFLYDQFIIHLDPIKEVLHRVNANHQPNVLVLALDSLSRFSFDRNLPITRQLLIERLQAVIMDGYNVLGDAADANIIPLLTGQMKSNWDDIRVSGKSASYVDAWPFVWNKYEDAGYATLYAEDQPDLGTFQLHFHGFEDKPVNHYMRPFWQAAADVTKTHLNMQHHCHGTQPEYEYLFTYLKQFFDKYNKRPTGAVPRFAFAFLTDVISDGEIAITRAFDQSLRRFLLYLLEAGLLDEMVLVVTSDHGQSYGSWRHTMRGKAEERLPFLAIALPTSFKTMYPKLVNNLVANRDRLTTALDVHATLLHLLNVQKDMVTYVLKDQMAVSLLHQIPIQRTCHSAGVDIHWCMCTYFEDVDINGGGIDLEWQVTAKFVVDHINKLLKPAKKHCIDLTLEHIVSAKYVIPSDSVIESDNKFYYDRQLFNFTQRHPGLERYQQIIIHTSPNSATFEATVNLNPTTGLRRISGQISRISVYGDDSKCILMTHPDLRKYCSCREAMNL